MYDEKYWEKFLNCVGDLDEHCNSYVVMVRPSGASDWLVRGYSFDLADGVRYCAELVKALSVHLSATGKDVSVQDTLELLSDYIGYASGNNSL